MITRSTLQGPRLWLVGAAILLAAPGLLSCTEISSDDRCPGGVCLTQDADLYGRCQCGHDYDPVCGGDGITYASECWARCNRVAVDYLGMCDSSVCVCPAHYAPVCGEDGQTYGNRCMASCADVEVSHEGECPCYCDAEWAPVCGIDGNTYGNSCEAACAHVGVAYEGECAACVCTTHWEPVCGVDGNTYGNACEAACAEVEIASLGECDHCEPVTCEIACRYGFQIDADGCPICACNPPPPDSELCLATGGSWDTMSCGHYLCGEFPFCDAIIPGCNCGLASVFEEGSGCRVDCTVCRCEPDERERELCEDTGGYWDLASCGHYLCGEFPACDAIIPGCNCGPEARFVDGEGCVVDCEVCPCDPPPGDRELCEETGGRWDVGSCGHYLCGQFPDCDAVIPGCDCGHRANFIEGAGCQQDCDVCACEPSERELCEWTDGRWDEMSCGHYDCGRAPSCEAIIPGCDCGEASNFVAGEGCVCDVLCF